MDMGIFLSMCKCTIENVGALIKRPRAISDRPYNKTGRVSKIKRVTASLRHPLRYAGVAAFSGRIGARVEMACL
jgi:hypothetical protein